MNKSAGGGIRYAGYELDFMTFRGMSRRSCLALTLVEVLVILVVLMLILGMLLPALANGNRHKPRIRCVNNLKNIGLAFRLYATDNQGKYPMQISTNGGIHAEHPQASNVFGVYKALSNELSTFKIVICPTDPKRKESTNFAKLTNRNMSYFVGLNSREDLPDSFLAGDRNIETKAGEAKPGLLILSTNEPVGWSKSMHSGSGNIAMGDGSVQQFTSARLQEWVKNSRMGEFQLSIP